MNYEKALNLIEELINYEKKFSTYNENNYDPAKVGKALKEERILINAKIFHIAGTKGKGSTSIYLASLIYYYTRENTGLYTSPHIKKINERISVNGKDITDDEFSKLIERFKDKFNIYGFTFFEALTFIAMVYFVEKECKYIVLETGLGGRLDATNFCNPEISIITRIGYDHTQILGKTLSKIAYEKAGIIKDSKPVITTRQHLLALRVIKNIAKEKKAKFYYLPRLLKYKIDYKNMTFDIIYKDITIKKIKYYIPSNVILENFLLSITTFKLYFNYIDKSLIEKTLKINLPYRMKIDGNFLFDVAHNDESLKKLFENVKKHNITTKKIVLILGVLADKELKRIAKVIKKHHRMFEQIFIVDFKTIRPTGGNELYKLVKSIKNISYTNDLKNISFDENKFYIITGSFYIMNEIEFLTKNFR